MSSQLIGSGRLGLTVEWATQKLEEHCPNFQQKLKNGLTVKEVIDTNFKNRQYISRLWAQRFRPTPVSCPTSIDAMSTLMGEPKMTVYPIVWRNQLLSGWTRFWVSLEQNNNKT